MTTVSYAQRGAMTLLRPGKLRWRAYFAPVNRTTNAPAVFDPARDGSFDLDSPPAPWITTGAVSNLKRTSATRIGPLAAGPKGAAAAQFRARADARLELDLDRKSTRLNSSHLKLSRMPSSA